MDGFQFLERVRSQSPDTARIILTGHADLPTVIQAVNAGDILRFLQKPCSPEALEEGLQAGLRQYQWIVGERRSAEEARQKLTEMHREIDISKATIACVESALAQSDTRFHATFDRAPVGICLLTSDGRIVESNDSFHRMIGFSRDELSDATLADWAKREDRRQVEECFENLVNGSQERCQFVGSYRRDDGHSGCVRITICRSPIATRELLAIAMVEDITENRRLEEQFLHAQ
jgi:PAS domain S-box-containing protein